MYRLEIELGKHRWQLLSGHGLYWPTQSSLFVADLHIGKTLRAGSPHKSPQLALREQLARLQSMIRCCRPAKLIILGDLLQARVNWSPDTCEEFDRIMSEQSDLEITLIRGNHDLRADFQLARWSIAIVDPPLVIDDVLLTHEPSELTHGCNWQLCGHLHPLYRRTISRPKPSTEKQPCFWLKSHCLILPALSHEVIARPVTPSTSDKLWIIQQDSVQQVTTL